MRISKVLAALALLWATPALADWTPVPAVTNLSGDELEQSFTIAIGAAGVGASQDFSVCDRAELSSTTDNATSYTVYQCDATGDRREDCGILASHTPADPLDGKLVSVARNFLKVWTTTYGGAETLTATCTGLEGLAWDDGAGAWARQTGGNSPTRYLATDAPIPCDPGVAVVFLDDSAVGDCDEGGGGSANSVCVCSDGGLGYVSGGGGSGVEVNNLEATDPPTIEDGEIYLGTGSGAGSFTPLATELQTDQEERYATANVLDYGAVCDWVGGRNPNPTDDSVAIQAAIDAVAADEGINALYFPRHCYVGTTQIEWERTVDLVGSAHARAGIVCADGSNVSCIVPISGDVNFAKTSMRNFQVAKAGVCVPEGGQCLGIGQACSGCTNPTDTLGHGIDMTGKFTGESLLFDNVWVSKFPQYGIFIHGSHPFWAQGLNLFGNGIAPADIGSDGIVDSATATTLVTTAGGWTNDEHIGKFVEIMTGTGVGMIRLITGNDANSVTVASWTASGGLTPVAGDTFEIDYGGGLMVRGGGGFPIRGCSVNNISGDGNEPALVTVHSGNLHSNSDYCSFYNLKSEPGGVGAQRFGMYLLHTNIGVYLNGISMTPNSPLAGSSSVRIAGNSIPEFSFDNISTSEANTDGVLSTMGLDNAADRFSIDRIHSGKFPERLELERRSVEHFSCTETYEGNSYYNTVDNEWCFCDGTNWVEMSDPTTTCS